MHVDEPQGLVSLKDSYDTVINPLGEVDPHVEAPFPPGVEGVITQSLTAALGQQILSQPRIRLLGELGQVLHAVGLGVGLPLPLYMLQEAGVVDSLVVRLPPGDHVLLVIGILIQPVIDGVPPPGGAAHDQRPIGGRQHGRQDAVEYRVVVVEEGGLVSHNEVRREPPELVLRVGQNDDSAAVPEAEYRLQPLTHQAPVLPGQVIQETPNTVPQDHRLPEPGGYNQHDRSWDHNRPDDAQSRKGGRLPALTRPPHDYTLGV